MQLSGDSTTIWNITQHSIVSVEDYGKGKQLLAEVELLRQESNRTNTNEIDEAMQASIVAWDDDMKEMNDIFRKLYSVGF